MSRYTGFAPRGYDLANHFNEWAADYTTDTPHVLDYALSPSEVQRRRFCERYLAQAGAASDSTTVEMLLAEVRLWSLVNHLYWGLWGLLQAVNSTIEFDYVMYGEQRFVQLKRELALL
jgi:choline/ethanolamine kinase